MKFIDKSVNRKKAHQLIDRFLDAAWDEPNNQYTKIAYTDSSFRSDLKQQLRAILVEEQEKLCCYCMRTIRRGNTTLEHIVPRSTTLQNKFNDYKNFPPIKSNVIMQSVFEASTEKRQTPPYPHQIAYENLTASCNGKLIDGIPKPTSSKFCNNKRGNAYAAPLFYDKDVDKIVEYTKGGLVVAPRKYAASIQNLNLNYQTLQKIRKIWFCLSKIDIQMIEEAETERKRNAILTINLIEIKNIKQRNQLIATFKNECFWAILMEFRWFYEYFRA